MFKRVMLVMGLALVGCAGLSEFFSNPSTERELSRIAVQNLTLRLVQDSPAEAASVVLAVDDALAVLGEVGETITAEALRALLDRVLPKEGLSLADQQLVTELSALAVAVAADGVSVPGEIPVDAARVVLGWVRESAQSAALGGAEGDGYGSP
jgi:hypothetical protein